MAYFFTKEDLLTIRENPHLIGYMVGKTKLTSLHSNWIKYIWDTHNTPDINQVYENHRALQAHRGSYKDIDVTEPVLTVAGFKSHGELKVGDKVFSPSGKVVKIIGVSEVFHNQCYELEFSDGHKIKCGEGHLWEVGENYWDSEKVRRRRRYVVKETKEIYQHDHKPDNRLSVKLTKPLVGKKKEFLINPYLLGVWLGDGHSEGGRITGHENDVQIIEELKKDGDEITSIGRDKRRLTTCTYGIKNLTIRLKALNLIQNKHVPEIYQMSSIEQRRALLQGLLDTDGSCNEKGNIIFVTIKENLAEDVLRLSRSLGLVPRIRKYTHYYKLLKRDYTHYKVSFRAYKKNKPFRLKRKLDLCRNGERVFKDKYLLSVTPIKTVKTNCIKVDSADGLYLVGKELTTTHNTTAITEIGCLWWLLFNPNDRIGMIRKTYTDAAKNLYNIRQYFRNEAIIALFTFAHGMPPAFMREREDSIRMNFKRDETKEGSIDVHGITSSITGSHYDKIICDDIVTLVDRMSKAEREKTSNFFREIATNIIDPGKQVAHVGTPWHKEDTWNVEGFVKPIKFDVKATGLLSDAEIEEKRKTTTGVLYACNYELNHISSDDAIFFNPEYKQWHAKSLYRVYAHIDAKYGGDHTGALTVMGRDNEGRIKARGWVFEENFAEDKVIESLLLKCDKNLVREIHMETNADKGFGAKELRRVSEDLLLAGKISQIVPIKEYHEKMNKDVKIQSYLLKYWHKIDWCRTMLVDPGQMGAYMVQILDYREKQEPNDAPDSIASLLRERFHRSDVSKDSMWKW